MSSDLCWSLEVLFLLPWSMYIKRLPSSCLVCCLCWRCKSHRTLSDLQCYNYSCSWTLTCLSVTDNMLQGCGRGRDLGSRRTPARDPAGRRDMPGAPRARSPQAGERRGKGLGVLHNSKNCRTCCRCWIKEEPHHSKTWTCSTLASSSRDYMFNASASSSLGWTRVVDRVSRYFSAPVAWLHPHVSCRCVGLSGHPLYMIPYGSYRSGTFRLR
jgi:hypothetical protein